MLSFDLNCWHNYEMERKRKLGKPNLNDTFVSSISYIKNHHLAACSAGWLVVMPLIYDILSFEFD